MERILTKQESDHFQDVKLKTMSYQQLAGLTDGFDLMTDGEWVWVNGYSNFDGYPKKNWHWDEIY